MHKQSNVKYYFYCLSCTYGAFPCRSTYGVSALKLAKFISHHSHLSNGVHYHPKFVNITKIK